MSAFKINDVTGDIVFENGKLVLLDGALAIKQHLFVKLQTFLGEWFLNTDLGAPWFRDVLVKNPNFATVQQMLKNQILQTPGVLNLLKFELDFTSSTRDLNFSFEVLTTDGPIDFSTFIAVPQ